MASKHLVLHCNSGGAYGMGHLMRCLALAEETLARGWTVTLGGDIDEAGERLFVLAGGDAPVRVPSDETGAWLYETVRDTAAGIIHLDSYLLDDEEIPRGGWLVSNMQDGPFGARHADLAIDPNHGAELEPRGSVGSDRLLLGSRYCPIRRQVRRQIGQPRCTSEALRVLVVVGGTDPMALGPAVATRLAEADPGIVVTLVSPYHDAPGVRPPNLTVLPFVDDLPALAYRNDAVVSAAGTSTWDFMCLGLPLALLCVVDNQVVAYRRLVEAGLVIGLGEPAHTDLDERLSQFVTLLRQPAALRGLAARGQTVIDGLGAGRIADAWTRLRP